MAAVALIGMVFGSNGAALLVLLRSWRQARSGWRRGLGGTLWSLLALLQTSALYGTVLGLYLAFTAVGGENIPPEGKARIMAESISEFMNYPALGGLFTPFSIGYLIWAGVRRRRQAS